MEARKITAKGETIFTRGMRFREYTNCWITTSTNNCHFNIVRHPELTVLDFSHGMGPLEKHIIDLKRPAWLEVIHEENVANKLMSARKDRNMGYKLAARYFDINLGK